MLRKLWKEIRRLIKREPNFKTWIDPRLPKWWLDDQLWRYLKMHYGLERDGIIDDENGLMLFIKGTTNR